MLARNELADCLVGDVWGEEEELDRDQLLRSLLSGVRQKSRARDRQMMMMLAKPSMAESIPNPMRAMEPASTPAVIATMPSVAIHASEIHESTRTRRAARSHSALGRTASTRRSSTTSLDTDTLVTVAAVNVRVTG